METAVKDLILDTTPQKHFEMQQRLTGTYWDNDVWDMHNPFFYQFPCPYVYKGHLRVGGRTRCIYFDRFPSNIKLEMKYYFFQRISTEAFSLRTALNYNNVLRRLGDFFSLEYSSIQSLVEIDRDKLISQWVDYLKKNFALKVEGTRMYYAVITGPYDYYLDYFDDREEYEKDIWCFKRIPGAHLTKTSHHSAISFTEIPEAFRNVVKRYIKYRATLVTMGTCYHTKMGLEAFFQYITQEHPEWADLKQLQRIDIEGFLSWYIKRFGVWSQNHITRVMFLKNCLEYMQLADYDEAPTKLVSKLFLPGDIPQRPKRSNKVRYIPEGVLQQLDEHLEKLKPERFIPIIILLRATGWRISDIMALRHNTCLDRTPQGWYLCGDIPKTQIIGHRVPITDEIAGVVQTVVKETIKLSTNKNNPYKLLFPVYRGKRRGLCASSTHVRVALNRLAELYLITDDSGAPFNFGNHAFRHTKAVELINNGMSLAHVQKWMAHTSPEMTLAYAHILDDTMRKSWEKATKAGLFRMDTEGKMRKIDLSEIKNEDIIEWEYIRFNLDAVRMPLGYCMKPKKQECHTQLNPCLTCRALCTTPDFIPQYECEIRETKVIIERGMKQNREVWVQKNQALLERYEVILSVLKTGKTHHAAGKQGREYVGEERAV